MRPAGGGFHSAWDRGLVKCTLDYVWLILLALLIAWCAVVVVWSSVDIHTADIAQPEVWVNLSTSGC